MKTIDRNVDASMPPATAVPTELRAPAPAPVAYASGSTPRMNANDVMRIGRSRMRAASTAASTIDRPCAAKLFGELDDQNRVLRGQPDQHDEADLAEHVVREAANQLRAQRAEHRQRHAQQNDERQHPALVLRREHEIDEHDRQREQIHGLAARLGFFERHARPREVVTLRQRLARDALHLLQRLARAHAGQRRARQFRRAEQVEMIDDRRRRRLARANDGRERHHVAVAARA